MVKIPEYKRDESKDYTLFLEGLTEIPFPVGKKLLIDFLKGNSENNSIEKNALYKFKNFGILNYISEERIAQILEEMIMESFVEILPSVFNNGTKVVRISESGKNRLVSGDVKNEENILSEEHLTSFKELEEFLLGFNNEQKKAVVSPSKKILCVAGAGTGKTAVLTKRIEFLVKMKRVSGKKIFAVTFTRKAKEELEKRLKEKGVEVVVETFNSFAEKILLKNGGKIYGRKTRIANFQDKMISVLRALEEINITMEQAIKLYFQDAEFSNKSTYELQKDFISDCFNIFENLKISGLTAERFKEKYFSKADEVSEMIFKIIKFTEKYFLSFGLRTYADQIIHATNFFKVYPKFIPNFDHILVDEFQDVNFGQIELLKILNPENLFCVGDPRQSIFGWRGSEIKYLMEFKKVYPESEIIYLKKNYRSSKKIIEFMNESIKIMNLPGLEHNFEFENLVSIKNFENEKNEFEFIKNEIISSEIPREEIFILGRTNKQIQEISHVLKKSGIKYFIKTEDKETLQKKGEVTLSTIHSAKGLEAQMVFVVGCTPKNFPLRYNEHPVLERIKLYDYNKEDEERRIFYVAVSRAKKYLYLTYSGKKSTYFINEKMMKMGD